MRPLHTGKDSDPDTAESDTQQFTQANETALFSVHKECLGGFVQGWLRHKCVLTVWLKQASQQSLESYLCAIMRQREYENHHILCVQNAKSILQLAKTPVKHALQTNKMYFSSVISNCCNTL